MFSIIIPAYNCESTIIECIASILDQDFTDFEVIVVDDASVDKTFKIIGCISDLRVKIVGNKINSGISMTRNLALTLATHKYVLFVDADDLLPKLTLSKLSNIISVYNPDYIWSKYKIFYETSIGQNGRLINKLEIDNVCYEKDEVIKIFLEDKIVSSVWAKVFRLELLQIYNINFEPFKVGEDAAFNLKYIKHSNKFLYFDDVNYLFRKHNNSTTSNIKELLFISETEKSFNNILDILGEEDVEKNKISLRIRWYRFIPKEIILRYIFKVGDQIFLRNKLREFSREIKLLDILSQEGLNFKERVIFFAFKLRLLNLLRFVAHIKALKNRS